MEHFNRLTPAEAERLALLSEECGEVVQAIRSATPAGFARAVFAANGALRHAA